MEIVGSGFSYSDLEVWLISQTGAKNYPMKILDMNDTFIKAGLSGGLPGDYIVEVRSAS